MTNPYLITAYVFTAALLGFYAWHLSRRKARVRREIESLSAPSPGA
jgi:CcmD family protein